MSFPKTGWPLENYKSPTNEALGTMDTCTYIPKISHIGQSELSTTLHTRSQTAHLPHSIQEKHMPQLYRNTTPENFYKMYGTLYWGNRTQLPPKTNPSPLRGRKEKESQNSCHSRTVRFPPAPWTNFLNATMEHYPWTIGILGIQESPITGALGTTRRCNCGYGTLVTL